MKHFIGLLSFLVFSFSVDAQIKTPAASPKQVLTQTVGLTDISLEYSRPSKKDRDIFSQTGLVPYGKIWRFGANSATKITFSDDVSIDGNKFAAGSYAMLAVPNTKEWIINFYPYEKGSWSSYKDANPMASIRTNVSKGSNVVETFTMGIGDITTNSAKVYTMWDKTSVSFPVKVSVDDRVMAGIEKTLAGPTANDYYAAGNYYHTSGKDLNKALEYVQMATKVDKPKFWQVRREALILADLGKYDEAIKAAKKSLDLAKAADNADYQKMNQESINEWITKK